MILNEIERAVICGTREYRTNADFIDAIEGAVLNKLCAGVEMPEPVAWAIQGSSFVYKGPHAEIDAKAEAMRIKGTCYHYPLYTATAIAAAALRALESAAVVCDLLATAVSNENFIAIDNRRICAKQIRAMKGAAA